MVAGVFGTITETLKDGALGTVGIVANNAVGNTGADLLKLTDPMYRQLTKVATATLLPVVLSMVAPSMKRTFCFAGSVAVAHEASKILDAKVFPMLGTVGKTFSSSDTPGALALPATATTPPGAATNGYGYVPTQPAIGYVPTQRAIVPMYARNPFVRESAVH